jgi:Tol biopolymer transport system component
MPDLREVFEMTTKQVEPDADSWREQEDRQRRSTRNRKIGGFVVAAAIALAAIVVGVVLATRSQPRTVPADQPSSPSPTAVPGMSVPFFLDLSTGATTRLPAGIPTTGRAYAVSPDRTMVATSPCCGPPNPVFVANIDGSDLRVITPQGVDGFGPQWSPDGSKLVYQERDAATQELGNLVVYDLATGERTQVTDLPPKSYGLWFISPSFTPDGRAILFHLPRGPRSSPDTWDLWTVPVTGGEPTLLHRNASMGAYKPGTAQTSPNAVLAFVHPSPGDWSSEVLYFETAGGHLGWSAPFRGSEIAFPKWSPDGTRIAYADVDGVYVYDAASEGPTEPVRVAEGEFPQWYDNNTLIISPAG